MSNEFLILVGSAFGAAFGAFVNFIITLINNRAQKEREKRKFERESYLKKEEELNKRNIERKTALSEIAFLISYFEHSTNFTASNIDLGKGTSYIEAGFKLQMRHSPRHPF